MSSSLKGKKIVLGISGSIAAYKSVFLLRLLIKAGAEVQVLMTEAATKFVAPLTFSTLSKNPVHTEVVSEESWNNHVEYGLWGDAYLIAPATANTLAGMAAGICQNMVQAVYLSARCPVFFAPAMDLDMWVHPATKKNKQTLEGYGNQFIPVEDGELASGLVGKGRMAEPENIIAFLERYFNKTQDLLGKKILVTAGPTYEPIDPVRFIGNRSSGKMGVAIAEAAAERGANVQLVLGPSVLDVNHSNIKIIRVKTAEEMYQASVAVFGEMDAGIMAAAVADYTPQDVSDIKIKKKTPGLTLELKKTKDIAAHLGKEKREQQLLVGFALETNNELENASAKLKKKNFDFIVLNSTRDKGATFGYDSNKITIINNKTERLEFELKSKRAVAEDILDHLVTYF